MVKQDSAHAASLVPVSTHAQVDINPYVHAGKLETNAAAEMAGQHKCNGVLGTDL